MTTGKKRRKRITTTDAERITRVASALADRIIAGEGLRLALPIVGKMADIVQAKYKNIQEKYGEVI